MAVVAAEALPLRINAKTQYREKQKVFVRWVLFLTLTLTLRSAILHVNVRLAFNFKNAVDDIQDVVYAMNLIASSATKVST